MEILRDFKNIFKFKKSVVTIGVFDGVHKGHQEIIKTCVKIARENQAKSIVLTFEPHPLEILKPGSHPPILTDTPLKAELIEELGVDYLLILEFNKNLANLSPGKFVNEIILKTLKTSALVIGEDFRFGKGAKGDANFLLNSGEKLGFTTIVVPSLKLNGELVSSSNIRHYIKAGQIEKVRKLLGHWPRITGVVIKGTGIARAKLGISTANIKTPDKASVPQTGVYAGFFWLETDKKPCVIHIGKSPTFDIPTTRVEAHILKFSADLYGKQIELEIRGKIRDIEKFEDEKALAHQINKDIKETKKILKVI
ncbi:MAG: bifunctional riboflavin kinase/FAD synthetase [Candidatus Subteraquimicrobiales bacterium]|nr:bifunctional riboflavin kinase/FAD synthetase [Candidatus Subteraquimicrobiales bacterium]